ncbi:hypothetical protein CHS0354_042959 [Potamilus streckersoni]|uniref:Uncharacterized protein n=1 Tax=Potamilus streckersoni TaxID=2493646 RepID=A0AAE0W7C9_9BIVA|nr:hypothetical protein CHS0354_042959 [Potamilus streckersoni]
MGIVTVSQGDHTRVVKCTESSENSNRTDTADEEENVRQMRKAMSIWKIMFRIEIYSLTLEKEITVAEIEHVGLLGIDILQIDERNCEEIIDIYVEHHESDESSRPYQMIIEPDMNFKQAYPLIMAAIVVDINNGVTQKVRLLNPFFTEVSLKQDSAIGTAETFQSMEAFVDSECQDHVGHCSAIRWVEYGDQADLTNGKKTTNTIYKRGFESNITGNIEGTNKKKTTKERNKIKSHNINNMEKVKKKPNYFNQNLKTSLTFATIGYNATGTQKSDLIETLNDENEREIKREKVRAKRRKKKEMEEHDAKAIEKYLLGRR